MGIAQGDDCGLPQPPIQRLLEATLFGSAFTNPAYGKTDIVWRSTATSVDVV